MMCAVGALPETQSRYEETTNSSQPLPTIVTSTAIQTSLLSLTPDERLGSKK